MAPRLSWMPCKLAKLPLQTHRMRRTAFYPSCMGFIAIQEEQASIISLSFVDEEAPLAGQPSELLDAAALQLQQYFQGERHRFDLPIAPRGTAFQQRVWCALREIPYGETRSYKQIAEAIGQPAAARAIGMANNKNPLLIITPCHRVIGADGRLVGFGAGLPRKAALLQIEGYPKFY